MWRTIQTASYCFHDVIAKTKSKKILLLPDAQETTAVPCDVGSPMSVVTQEFGDLVDSHMVTDEWTSKKGRYGTDAASLRARAKALRQWLRARPEGEIVVVSHGAILDYVVKENLDENGVFKGMLQVVAMFSFASDWSLAGFASGWGNREWRTYRFDPAEADECELIEEEESLQRRRRQS